jgi:site-specific DNA-cytosine methylase
LEKEGGKVKKIWMMTAALGLGIWLTGCSPAFVPVEDPSESQTEERNSPEMEKVDKDKWQFKKDSGKTIRRMSVRECARIQTFPDNFVFTGARMQQYKQVGNAVPVKLGYEISKGIKAMLDAHYESQ